MAFGRALDRACEPKDRTQPTGKSVHPSTERPSVVSRSSSGTNDSGTVLEEDNEQFDMSNEEVEVGADGVEVEVVEVEEEMEEEDE